ncbi:hypothetical protein BGX38DRAFT_1226325 [Terfezia claveryi]|nr:hypothetical protein BGX38DRAFT_1226325 [Terfezia claveryi]
MSSAVKRFSMSTSQFVDIVMRVIVVFSLEPWSWHHSLHRYFPMAPALVATFRPGSRY